MKVSVKLILGVFSLSTVACAPKVTTTPPAVNVEDPRSFDRHLTTRMREAFAEQDVPDSLARSAQDVKFLTRGGPPGQVTLEGALVKTPTETDSHVSIDLAYGVGRNKQQPKNVTAKPNLFMRQSDASRAQIDALGTQQTYALVGCLFKGPESTDGLTNVGFKVAPETKIEAKVVQICKAPLADYYSLHIVAERIVISDLDMLVQGLAARQVTLIAKEIVILNKSSLRTKGTNDELTYAPGPGLFISAGKVSGDGRLSIQATGSNFVSKY